jgi:hypothetical protein
MGSLYQLRVATSRSAAACAREEDLIDVGEDEDGEVWKVVRVLTYRWSRTKEGRWAYRLRYICLHDETESSDDG